MGQEVQLDLEQDTFDKFIEELELKLYLAGKEEKDEETREIANMFDRYGRGCS